MNTFLYHLKRSLPRPLLQAILPLYHFLLAWSGAVMYRHPSRHLTVIGITGTKGKSTTTELVATILRAHGAHVASLSTIDFTIDGSRRPNLYKMTLPGRFFLQQFLRDALRAGCTYAVIELTSEGARQFRHRFVELDSLIFTNLTPEHIESHGSFEKYKAAKLDIATQLLRSGKRPRTIVANTDDPHGADFLATTVEQKIPYGLSDLKLYTLHKDGVGLVFSEQGEECTIRVPLVGLFNVYNALAAISLTRAMGVPLRTIERALRHLPPVKGRVEHIESSAAAPKKITAVVDYAHTPDSLEKLYQAFKNETKICVLGNTGGGRDSWKRPEMGRIASEYCERVILTNEDPYDEDPRAIVEAMAAGITQKEKLEIIMDRRAAIRTALEKAPEGGYVLISGKGTDPYIMGPKNSRESWSDAAVVREELHKLENGLLSQSDSVGVTHSVEY